MPIFEKLFPKKTQTEKPFEKITPEQEEKDLLEKKIIKMTPLESEGHLNPAFFVDLENGLNAIFKRTRYFKQERAAYLVSHALEFDLVPTTVIREIKEGTKSTTGCLQKFIPETRTGEEISLAERQDLKEELKDQFFKYYVFAYLITDWDYVNPGNYLIDRDKKIWSIDHGFSFPLFPERLFDLSLRISFGRMIPQEIKEKLKKFSDNPNKIKLLRDQLQSLIDDNEIERLLKKVKKLTELFEENISPALTFFD